MKGQVHLGYEVGTGKAVSIPLRHMVICGQTQEAGKTTTLEALIDRANLPAVAFVTKRGEASFAEGRRIQPYFRERADWQFVQSVIEAAMHEKKKFERPWIIRASEGARTLAQVHGNVKRLMQKAKGMSADMYLLLDEYLKIVVPRIAQVDFAEKLDLEPGLNVLDLSHRDAFPPELQGLVMRSALEWIYEKCNGTIAIIPEAWEFLPQGRGSPVKLAAVELIRKGAGLKNYVWLDSQDIGGVDKEVLRSCPVWLLGVQRETNEIKRVLENIPHPTAKPKPSDVATLKKGQFYACFGETVVKTYVQPEWMKPEQAREIAMGGMTVEQIRPPPSPMPKPRQPPAQPKETPMSANLEKKMDQVLDAFQQFIKTGAATQRAVDDAVANGTRAPEPATPLSNDEEAIYLRFRDRLLRDSTVLNVLATAPQITVEETIETITIDGKTPRGRVVRLLHDGFFDQSKSGSALRAEMKRTGADPGSNLVRDHLNPLTIMGFLTRDGDDFVVAPNMKKHIRKA